MPVKTKKVTKRFRRFFGDRILRLRTGWRKPHGIDNPMRRRFKGTPAQPKIGYGTDRRFKYQSADGKKRFNVSNLKDIEMLLMHNRQYAAVINHNVGAKTRKLICERAKVLGIKVVNGAARLVAEEKQ